jgi:hypothetical protein
MAEPDKEASDQEQFESLAARHRRKATDVTLEQFGGDLHRAQKAVGRPAIR